ncbi:MAG: efflux RND transporter periplasmic adaptor subunit [Simplicispira sp.]|nr:efflux RND transporter periplasmic adaptor subunit [Simplicispira sp.]
MPQPTLSLRGRLPTLLCVLALAACSRPEPPPEPVRAVKLLTVGTAPLTAQVAYAGEVRARTESRLGFRVPGKILQRQAELGQRVHAGQLLAQLDPRDFELAAAAARAQVSAARTQRDLAAADAQRYEALKAQNFISGAELERRHASLKAAQASLDQAQAQAAAQGNQSAYTRLVADADGVVTGVDAEPGQVVAAGASVVRLARDGARDVVFAVPEDKLARMAVGQQLAVQRWAGGAALVATVRELAASADPATRTFAVKAAIEGAEAPPLGATVTVVPPALSARGAEAIVLPTTALMQSGDGTAVWVFDAASSTVRAQAVQIATADGNQAVLASGLAPGMQVVATGVHVLAPGQRVTVYEDKYAPALAGNQKNATQKVANSGVPASAAATAAARR